MKILGAQIHWYLGWGNSPDIYLWLDSIPKWEDMIHTQHFTGPSQVIWLAEKDNWVSYYVDRTTRGHAIESRPDQGLGGRHVKIHTNRGEHTLKGPWISNPTFANVNHPTAKAKHIAEVTYTTEKKVWEKGYTYYSGFCVQSWLDNFLDETFGCRHSVVTKDNGYTTVALNREKILEIPEKTLAHMRNTNRFAWRWSAENGAENTWLKGQDLLNEFQPQEV